MVMLGTSLLMATVAAFISVTGLAKLFAGAGVTIFLVAGAVEFSKVVMTTYLHKSNFKENLLINILMSIMTVVIMGITSLGVYGFLANGYTVTSNELNKNEGKISLVGNKIDTHVEKVNNLKSQKESLNARMTQLTGLRIQQESRVDSLYKKGYYSIAKKEQNKIDVSDKSINELSKNISKIDSIMQIENEKIGDFKSKIIDLNNSDVNAELGPLKYISKITGFPMDNVINYIILVLIFVFDPAAVLMLIAANRMLDKAKEQFNQEQIVINNEQVHKEEYLNERSIEECDIEQEFEDLSNDFFAEKQVKDFNEVISKNLILNEEKKTLIKNENNDFKIKNTEKPIIGLPEKAEIFFQEKQEMEKKFKELLEKKNQLISSEVQQEVDEDNVYIKLITALYKNGEIKKGDDLPSFKDFKQALDENKDLKYDDKLIRDFLAACNLVKIIDTSKQTRKALKNFKEAKDIIKII